MKKAINLFFILSAFFIVYAEGKTVTDGIRITGGGVIEAEGATNDAFETQLQFTDPTADRVVTVKDEDGTVALVADIEGANEPLKQYVSTGWIGTPPSLSINGGDNTKFDMTSGTLQLVDSSTNPPTITEVAVSSATAVSPTFLATDTASFISVGSGGTITQRNVRNSPEQRRDSAEVGFISHPDNLTIDVAENEPQILRDALSQTHDLIRALGFFSISGNGVTGVSATLTMDKASGVGFGLNVNAAVNPKDPHEIVLAAQTPMTLFNILRDATFTSQGISTSIDPTVYDNAGVETAVPSNNNATISRLYIFPNGQSAYLIGQEVFANIDDAISKAGTESMVLPTDIAEGGLLLGRWVVKKNATDLTDTSEALFVPAEGVSGGGATLTTLQAAYNISVDPEIETDSTRGSVDIRRGSAADTDDVFTIENGAGTKNTRITGEGKILTDGNVVLSLSGDGVVNTLDSGVKYFDGNGDEQFLLRANNNTGAIAFGPFAVSPTQTVNYNAGTGSIEWQINGAGGVYSFNAGFQDRDINFNKVGSAQWLSYVGGTDTVTLNALTSVREDLQLENDTWISMKDSGGTVRTAIQVNTNDQMLIGNTAYEGVQIRGIQNYGSGVEQTISGGAVTITGSYHSIDTEGDAASDTLDTINGGTVGSILYIRSNNSGRDVTVAETGNIRLAATTRTLDTIQDILMLIKRTSTDWAEVSFSDNN